MIGQIIYNFIEWRVNEKMGKKMTSRALQAKQRREEMLQTAKRLFAEQGYHATTTKSINQAMGMADGLMYHYFPGGKEEILLTLMKEEIAKKMEKSKELLDKLNIETPLEEMLTEVADIILKATTRDKNLLTIFIREFNLLSREIEESLLQPFTELLDKVKLNLLHKKEQGLLNDLEVDLMVIQFFSSIAFTILPSLSQRLFVNMPETELVKRTIEHTISTWKK